MDYEKLGAFYLGKAYDLAAEEREEGPLLYDSKDLVTHAVCVGMTGSGKTGLGVILLEEAAIDGVPSIVIDPKGDMGNLLLTFPNLAPAEFRPWINEDEARRKSVTPDEYATAQSELWTKGLQGWGQTADRIARLREAAEFTIYTPGSESGIPVSILDSFAAPSPELAKDKDLMRDRVGSTATSILGLLGIDADPIQSREHILLSTLLDHYWSRGENLDLGALIHALQNPPIKQVGVMDLESFFPAKQRFALAMKLNNLLAAPGFQSWLTGASLDLSDLLYTPEGKPRVAIFSIAHLSDEERMFFVSLLLNQTISWMRSRPGTTSLRAMLYMDEIFGYMPPVAEPPSKKPLLTLLKQARAYGLGVVLSTQNPVDLDYKGLSNTGTWFIGRLQTERDKERMLEGLEGISSSGAGGFNRRELDRMIGGLGKRVFLLHNVHEPEPVVFETRWAMSYLRGPLTRDQISTLMAGRERPEPVIARPKTESRKTDESPAETLQAEGQSEAKAPRPVLVPDISQVFLPIRSVEKGELTYRPQLLGLARVHFVDRKNKKTVSVEEPALILSFPGSDIDLDWADASPIDLDGDDLETEAFEDDAGFGEVPEAASESKSYTRWKNELSDHLYRTSGFDLLKSSNFDIVSQPGESERDFRLRLVDLSREERDERVEKLREKYRSKFSTLEEKIRTTYDVRPMDELQERIRKRGIKIAIVAVPAAAAREVVEALVAAGIEAILNFAPLKLEGKEGAYKVRNVDLAVDLGVLSFWVTGKK